MKFLGPQKYLAMIEASVQSNLPLLLLGETGVGKTTAVKEISKKMKKNLTRINLTGETRREDLIGKYTLINGETIWQDGPLTVALRNGDWVLLDEMNAALPDVLLTIQALSEAKDGHLGDILLAEKDGEKIIPHKDCRLFATANPADKYVGTKDFNPATLDRFNVIRFEVLDQKTERELLETMFPKAQKEIIYKLTTAAVALRKAYQEEQITYFCSTRVLVNALGLIEAGLDLENSVEAAIFNKVTNEFDKDMVKDLLAKNIGMTKVATKKIIAEIDELREGGTAKAELEKVQTQFQTLKDEMGRMNQAMVEASKMIDVVKLENQKLKTDIERVTGKSRSSSF